MPRRLRIAGRSALGLSAFVAIWQAIHLLWGPFVLPSPGATLAQLLILVAAADTWRVFARTAAAALGGFAGASLVGIGLGLAAGRSRVLYDLVNPSVVVILGVPPIAWVVLALLWFGASGAGAALTAGLALLPLVFAATVQGVRALDPGLEAMARAFGAGRGQRLFELRLPQLASHVVPALATAHGIAWKATVMAEVLGAGRGLGAELALARTQLDLPRAMALVALAAIAVLAADALVFDPWRRRVEAWRRDAAAC